MALQEFEAIRELLCGQHKNVTKGRMMSSPALHYKGKVFVFFSTKQKMVFKFGKGYPIETLRVKAAEFNPFTTKKPLAGWYEVNSDDSDQWTHLSELALTLAKKNFK